jgi:protein involved in polysaccharide export with SLBB domain
MAGRGRTKLSAEPSPILTSKNPIISPYSAHAAGGLGCYPGSAMTRLRLIAQFLQIFSLALFFGLPALAGAAETATVQSNGYTLFSRDTIRISVLGEPELSVERRIDGNGRVSLPLIGTVMIRGLSVAAAEEKIRTAYIEQEMLVRPQVAVTVTEYFPREVAVLGQVTNPGNVVFPIEATSISVIDAISRAGGFTRLAKGDNVRITRRDDSGAEETSTVNVAGMIAGKGNVPALLLRPGDVVFVPERVF